MRQSFDVKGGPAQGRTNLKRLRAVLKQTGLDGVFVPHEDEYQNEYLPEAHERLAWATGFTGSAGAAWIFADRATVFVDGRYTLQAEDQLDPDLFDVVDLMHPGPAAWLAGQELEGAVLGYDPKLVSPDQLETIESAAAKAGARLVATAHNPIDAAWTDRPTPPAEIVKPHALEFAGETSADKRARLALA
ncbi:MAG: aminopeptidase P family N-terminal domain-containing protein, partial [Pseudomonadota bacterium]